MCRKFDWHERCVRDAWMLLYYALGNKGDVGAGRESEGAVGDHGGSKIAHERKSLGVQVAKHGVGLPSADQTNDVGVNVTAEERHGAAGP